MSLIERDLRHIWHPCSQMKDYETFPPLEIVAAQGSYIQVADGRRIIDAISSWWCKSLGHQHPRLKAALHEQIDRFEQVMVANATYETLVLLSEKLAGLTQNLDKVFYASDGSCAVEIAIKMSLHAQQLRGHSERNRFMALENSYHGETCLTLSLSDLGIYRKAYESQCPPAYFLKNLPYVHATQEPLWNDCSAYWPKIEEQLNQHESHLAAIIVEPIVQGAGGMLMYSQDFLRRLRRWTQSKNIYLIADEIMTGLGRTGYMLACEHAQVSPDFICLGKGLTAGCLPMSAVLTSTETYRLFYDDYEKGKSFLHSHTFGGNALAASVALACLTVLEDEQICSYVREQQAYLKKLWLEVAEQTQKIQHVRSLGFVVAADLILNPEQKTQRYGYKIFKEAVQRGAWLRPLGNTLYWLPPLNTETQVLEKLRDVTIQAIQAVY